MTPTEMPQPPAPAPVALEQVAPESVAFLDAVTNAVNSGDLSGPRELTRAAMMDYASESMAESWTFRVRPRLIATRRRATP